MGSTGKLRGSLTSGSVLNNRVFGAENIRRVIQSQKSDPAKGAENSIATGAHEHSRQAARLRRQAERMVAKVKGR